MAQGCPEQRAVNAILQPKVGGESIPVASFSQLVDAASLLP